MQGKKRGLLAVGMVCALLLTMLPMAAGADNGEEIEVKLYTGKEVWKPGSTAEPCESVELLAENALDTSQPDLVRAFGTDWKERCPAGYVMDGWRVWAVEDSEALSSRWISSSAGNWASRMTGCFSYDNGAVLAPNWTPEYTAGSVADTEDGPAAVIKKTEDDSIVIKGNDVEGGSVAPDGSIQTEDTKFSFQWLHGYRVVDQISGADQIVGAAIEDGNYYNQDTRQWMKGNGQTDGMGISCELKAGDVVVVDQIGDYYDPDSDWQYYLSACLIKEEDGSKSYLETYDRENRIFYAEVPESGRYTLYLRNVNQYMEVNASVSVFRADAAVVGQTGAVYTGGSGTYCCQTVYEKAGQKFSLLSAPLTIAGTPEHAINLECGEHGSCTVEVDGKAITGPAVTAEWGQTVTIKTIPDAGYEEDHVSVRYDSIPIFFDVPLTTTEDGNGGKIRTFTMPDCPVRISVQFRRAKTWGPDKITGNGVYQLEAHMPYVLGGGTWKIKGDSTDYAGGNTFYVLFSGSYEFRKQ